MTHSEEEGRIQVKFEREDMDVRCSENQVLVYDGVPSFVDTASSGVVLGSVCNAHVGTFQSTSGNVMAVYFRSNFEGGFNASFQVLRLGGSHVEVDDSVAVCPANCSGRGVCSREEGRCICEAEFGGRDCASVADGSQWNFESLPTAPMSSRFGHSMNAFQSQLWIFGGFSLALNKPLGDIRAFDTLTHQWIPVTVELNHFAAPQDEETNSKKKLSNRVSRRSSASSPEPRYFHASALVKNRLYVFGGMNAEADLVNDFWAFDIEDRRWTQMPIRSRDVRIESRLVRLSGHSMTHHPDKNRLVVIGGYSALDGFSDSVLHIHLDNKHNWSVYKTYGYSPLSGIYGHSTVYHRYVV